MTPIETAAVVAVILLASVGCAVAIGVLQVLEREDAEDRRRAGQ